jgi:hypothetical protein
MLAKRTQRKKSDEDNDAEIKFYKKRIISLFKDLLKGTEPYTHKLKELHAMFTRAAINYFETADRQDIIQEQYAGIDIKTDIEAKADAFELEEANEYMMRKTINISNLDNYVLTTTTCDNSANPLRVIPLKLDIDLKAPHLKTKGVKVKHVKAKHVKAKQATENKKISVYNTNEDQTQEHA